MTRAQENHVAMLAREHGQVAISPYADKSVEITVPGGACWRLSPAGTATKRPFNHSIDWNS
jgi:hypothetical protein